MNWENHNMWPMEDKFYPDSGFDLIPQCDKIDLPEGYKNARTLPPVDKYTFSFIRKEREGKLALMGIGTGFFK
jgi:hypothetical protein